MIAESLLSSLDVVLVSVDSIDWISAKQLTNAVIIPTILQNVQRNSAFANIIRLLDVLLLEQELKIIRTKPENARVGEHWPTLVIVKQGRLCDTALKHDSKV